MNALRKDWGRFEFQGDNTSADKIVNDEIC